MNGKSIFPIDAIAQAVEHLHFVGRTPAGRSRRPEGATLAANLHAHWDDGEIVEIMGVVALFGFLNRWNDSMATTIEAGAAAAARSHLSGIGWTAGKHGE